jgi:hypothetical protein
MGNNTSNSSQFTENDTLTKKITNVMVDVTNTDKTDVSVMQNIILHVGKNGSFTNCTVDLSNKSNASVTILSKITSNMTVALKTALTSDTQSKTGQINKVISELGGNWGTSNSASTFQSVINRATQIIEENVTVKKLNQILTGVMIIQGIDLTIDGPIVCAHGGTWTLSNDSQLNMVATSLITDLTNIGLTDTVISRIVSDAQQSATVHAQGLQGLLGALTGPIVALIIAGIIAFALLGTQTIKSATDPKFLMVMGGVAVLYVIVAYFRKWVPFRVKVPGASTSKQPWVCEQIPLATGSATMINTGRCTQWAKSTAPPVSMAKFDTEAQCNTAAGDNCPMYWGCGKDATGNFTGSCAQYDNPTDGPYASLSDPTYGCNAAIVNGTDCRQYWGCGDGIVNPVTACQQYQNVSDGPQKTQADCKAQGGCAAAPAPPAPAAA